MSGPRQDAPFALRQRRTSSQRRPVSSWASKCHPCHAFKLPAALIDDDSLDNALSDQQLCTAIEGELAKLGFFAYLKANRTAGSHGPDKPSVLVQFLVGDRIMRNRTDARLIMISQDANHAAIARKHLQDMQIGSQRMRVEYCKSHVLHIRRLDRRGMEGDEAREILRSLVGDDEPWGLIVAIDRYISGFDMGFRTVGLRNAVWSTLTHQRRGTHIFLSEYELW